MVSLSNIVPIIILVAQMVTATNLVDELRITYDQKVTIEKLRRRVLPFLSEDYMKEDLHLLRWLRASRFDIKEAEERIRQDVKWRKQNKIETLPSEDLSDLEDEYPLAITVDKQGQPVLIGYAGEWDIRASTLTGRIHRLVRYVTQHLEVCARLVRQLQYNGKNVTRFDLIIDLGGYSPAKHACVECLIRILDVTMIHENHYPGFVDRAILLNTPPTIAVAAEMVRTSATPETWRSVKLYGTDRSVWQKALLEFIDRDKLPEQLGGTLKSDREPNLENNIRMANF